MYGGLSGGQDNTLEAYAGETLSITSLRHPENDGVRSMQHAGDYCREARRKPGRQGVLWVGSYEHGLRS